ncbi:hypothetical protein ACSSS7_001788 [Eimeria intestinalis]
MDDASTRDSLLPEDEGIYFPLSQPDPPTRQKQACASASVQRRRRSATCCSAPYIAASQKQKLVGPLCAALGSGVYRQHTPPPCRRSTISGASSVIVQQGRPKVGDEAERVARELAEAAVASAQALAADAHAVDPGYTAKPTAFLYKGHTAQIATSTAGMYGEMIESFIKQAFGLSLETQRLLLLRDTSDRLRSLRVLVDPREGCSGDATAAADAGVPTPSQTVRELFDARPRRAVAFAHDDLSAFADLEGVTHAYSFDAAMEGPLIN